MNHQSGATRKNDAPVRNHRCSITSQLFFFKKTFRIPPVDNAGKGVQPWVGLIETGYAHDDW